MKIEDFCAEYGANTRTIDDVVRRWQLIELDGLLQTLRSQHDPIVGSAVIAGDVLYGDGMLDQIPSELKDAFSGLMGEKANTYNQIRQILHDKYVALDQQRLASFTSYIKGRIGENLFREHVGHGAALADSVVQKGWDASVPHEDGLQYIQVKLYSDPHGVVRHMVKVHQDVLNGTIKGVDHVTPVEHIFFAVPEDIKGDVQRIVADRHPELLSMIYDKSIPIDAHGAAAIVSEGICNVGPDQLSHFFHELLGGAVAAGSLHAVVNGFLWYKGSKEFSAAFAGTAASAAISTTGIFTGLVTESLCHAAMLSGAVGIGSRLLLGRMARSRWNFAEFLEKSTAMAEARAATLQQLLQPQPATDYPN